jgi:6-phosphogluconolactonase
VFHPNGAWAYLITESSTVIAMRWEAGVLTRIQTVSTLPTDYHGDSGAAEIEVHPNGRFLYASNRGHDSIAVFAIDPTGTLTPIQDIAPQGVQPASFRISPNGAALFVANVMSNNIAGFRIDPRTGLLSATGTSLSEAAPVGIRFAAVR